LIAKLARFFLLINKPFRPLTAFIALTVELELEPRPDSAGRSAV